MRKTQIGKAANGMQAGRVSTICLASSLAVSALVFAQSLPTLPAGDAARGKAIFEGKGNCRSCHRVNGVGSMFGPDLSSIGAPPRGGGGRGAGGRGAGGVTPAGGLVPAPAPATAPATPALSQEEQLEQSILDPNAVMSVQNRYVRLAMKDGKTISGKLLNVDTFAVQIFDSNEKLMNISKENVKDMTMVSPMPSYRDKLTTQELADVVGYLMSLKGQ
jgi:mono/diheme cytochrome c family protein